MIKFLVVEDEPYVLRDLEESLRQASPAALLSSFTSPSQALKYAKTETVDVAFLDIELGSINGLVLAKKIKEIQPEVHIIFVTSYEKYAVGAFQLHATGYLMKPVTVGDILRELTFIYGEPSHKKIRVQTFGGFAVFVDEKPVNFTRSKSKELLAYLVNRRGAGITTPHACSILWEDVPYDKKQKNYFQLVLSDLRTTLRHAQIEQILLHSRNSLAIDPSQLECDSYQFMDGDPRAVNHYRHDYLCDYSWAEFTLGLFERGMDQ